MAVQSEKEEVRIHAVHSSTYRDQHGGYLFSRVGEVAGAHFHRDLRLIRETRGLVVVRSRFPTPLVLFLEYGDVF